MPILGRKPSGDDIGFGELWGGNSRASIMGRPSVNGWATLIGGRLGYGGSSAVTMQLGLYGTSGSTTVASRIATSAPFSVGAYMRHGAGGATYERAFSGGPVQVYKKYDYAIAAATHGGGLGSFGQDHSGWPMHDRVAILPNPYSASTVSAQGRMSLWINIVANRAPNKPSSLSPAPGSITSDSTPTIGASFSDPDEVFSGYSIGQADKMRAYRLEVLNQGKTSRVWDTGKVTASGAQQTARRVEVTTSALSAGTYVARATFWDQFDTPSPAAEWSFTINAGGAFQNTTLRSNIAPKPDLSLTADPTFDAEWTHSDGLTADRLDVRIRNSAGTVVRGPLSAPITIDAAPGALVPFRIGQTAIGFAELTPGQTYTLDVRGRDTTGLWSPWSGSIRFTVNAAPNVPSHLSPSGTVHSSPPTLGVAFTDANDEPRTLSTEYWVRLASDAGDGVQIPQSRQSWGGNRRHAYPNADEMPVHGVYQWRVRATDPWGTTGPYSAWQTITYATAPTVTITTPADDTELSTGTPTLEGTVDKAITAYSVTIRTDSGASVLSTGDVTTGGTSFSYTVPAATLRHDTTYDATVEVLSTEGLRGSATVRFTVRYEQPAAVESVTAEPTPGPHEPDADPSQWSRIVVSWAPATVEDVSDDDFAGYVIRRVDLGTGDALTLATLGARGDTVFLDRTPRSGVAYRYEVSYLAVRNTLDIVESVTAGAQSFVTLRCTVLTSMDDDDLHVPLRHWSKRKVDWIGDEETETAIGLEKPIAFRGATDYNRLRGTWTALDDPHGTYTARDLVAEIRRMKRYRVTDDGELAPRIVLYRDPRRSGFYVITSAGEDDERSDRVAPIDIDLTEVHATEGIGA